MTFIRSKRAPDADGGSTTVRSNQSSSRLQARTRRAALAAILIVALVFHLWGIRRDLPYVTEDLKWIVNPALRIAASGNPNPRQFAYPGSTLIYPLAGAYHVWNAVAHHGSWVHPDSQIGQTFETHPVGFLLIGRLLTVGYAVMSIPLVYEVGQMAFGEKVALIGALLTAVQPTEVFDKRVTTNSASLFFCALSLWCCLRLLRRSSFANQLIAGAAIGLAIGTKYPLGTLVVALFIVDVMLVWRARMQPAQRRVAALGALAGLLAVSLGFLLSTPYFLIDFATAASDISFQFRRPHLGADGLSPVQNLLWYVADALPASLDWPQRIAVVLGIAAGVWQRRQQQIVLLLFVVSFICGISASSLHWVRWLIPVLPVFALFAANGLDTSVTWLSARLGFSPRARDAVLACTALFVAAAPASHVVRLDRLRAAPSTSVLARQWVEANIPAGQRVAYEWDTLPPPLARKELGRGLWTNPAGGRDLVEGSVSTLAVKGSLDFYRRTGFRYLVTSSIRYTGYAADPEHYPAETAFYNDLLAKGRLLHQVDASPAHEGTEIRIYEIS